ncbi:MAG: CD225/dispanin family protein [Candidatus Nanopelagicales bacterium]|jgi:hypothetical protein|nr:CD225/dispanin family protein [Actinomycetota bacterium]MDC1474384.1 CD225/dispanin family protein [Candidatus Nanopelagicales bacterium]MBT5183384.1 CD225/dispanin family protein [Actinomycetota bacterium]MBT5501949.1 CD225/dispanin family protein [Actinomycetota bacterium]MBT5806835.1 CD225/dispanin family protein [Actinomycetota bacterium]
MTATAKTYVRSSVVGAIFFFLPFGVVALTLSFTARRRFRNGDESGAVRASRWAKRFMILTYVVGVIIYLLIIVSLLALGAFSS